METPREVIEERQRALAGPGDPPVSQRELARMTERYKGGPIASSTISRWAANSPGPAKPEQLEIFARATADASMPYEALLRRLRLAFGFVNEDPTATPWEPPPEAQDLTPEDKRWLTSTVKLLARKNRAQAQGQRQAVDENGVTPPAEDGQQQ